MHISYVNKLIDFTMEIAKGCRHNCSGCVVDKEDNSFPTEAEFDKLDKMVDDFESNNLQLLSFIIGPTDILSSENMDDVLSHPRMKSLARRFVKTTLNCAFLDPNPSIYEKLAEQVEELIPNGLLKFTIPFEIRHLDNLAYIEGIRNRIAFFESCLKTVEVTRVYAVVNFEESIANDKRRNFTLTHDMMMRSYKVDIHPMVHSDFILPHGRDSLRDVTNRDKFLSSLHHLNDLLLKTYQIGVEKNDIYDIVELQLSEGEDWDLVYRNGELYIPPFIVEAFASFEPEYKVSGEWTFDSIFDQKTKGFFEAIEIAQTNGICTGCEFIAKCAERGVQKIMEITKSDRCISLAKTTPELFNWKRRD